jgi:hypothetical protein
LAMLNCQRRPSMPRPLGKKPTIWWPECGDKMDQREHGRGNPWI